VASLLLFHSKPAIMGPVTFHKYLTGGLRCATRPGICSFFVDYNLERLVLDESQVIKDNMSVGRAKEFGLIIDRGYDVQTSKRDSFLKKRSSRTSKLTSPRTKQ
jgi:hypothetical protein